MLYVRCNAHYGSINKLCDNLLGIMGMHEALFSKNMPHIIIIIIAFIHDILKENLFVITSMYHSHDLLYKDL